MKFDIEKFDEKIDFSIWCVQMMVVLIQYGLKKALGGKLSMLGAMIDKQWNEFDEKAFSAIQLCLSHDVLRVVIKEKTTIGLWLKLESLYMTKSVVNKLRLRERLYTLKMAEGTLLRSHLDEFNSILIDLTNLEVNINKEDTAILLVYSLPCSYCNFKDIILYGSGETLFHLKMSRQVFWLKKNIIQKIFLMSKLRV